MNWKPKGFSREEAAARQADPQAFMRNPDSRHVHLSDDDWHQAFTPQTEVEPQIPQEDGTADTEEETADE